ncbi:MAG: sigma-70 family RNA polymerase sigma factor [Candidatus Omnitrophota bacterium]
MNRKKPDKGLMRRERALVSRCVKNDKKAWGEFVDKYKGIVYDAIIKTFHFVAYKNTEDMADDLFQEVFSLLLKNDCAKLRSFRWKNGCSLASWLHIVAKNVTFDYLRKYFSRGKIMELLTVEDGDAPADYHIEASVEADILQKLEDEERAGFFEKALKTLPKEDFLVINLIYLRGISHENTAKMLGKSIDALYMQKKRVIEKIKKTVESYLKHN